AWKKAVSFLGSLPVPLKQVNWKPDYKGSYTTEEEAIGQWRTEIRLTDPDAKSRYNTKLAQLLPRYIYLPCVVDWNVLNRMGCNGEIDDMLRIRLRKAGSDEEIFNSVAWIRAFNINEPIYNELCNEFYSTYEFDEVCADDELQVLTEDVVRSLSAPIYCRDLDTITLRDLINSDGKLIPKDPQSGVPRFGIPRPPGASMQDLYDMMGRMEIRQEAIERMEYRQSYHRDRYQGVFKHMAGVYSIPMQGAYNPPGYAQPQYDQYYQQ
ncbi:hypothetical protein Tco_0862594, partial [Tanacetum coccineum]